MNYSILGYPWFFWALLLLTVFSIIHVLWFIVKKGFDTYDKKTPFHCNVIVLTLLLIIALSFFVIFSEV